VRAGDGERDVDPNRFKVGRGGSFRHEAAYARSSCRNNTSPETKADHLGVRPARKIDP